VSTKFCVAILLITCLRLTSGRVVAQQGSGFPNLGNIGPSKGEVIGAIAGAAAVIGLAVYLLIPKQKTIEGCVQSSDSGLRLKGDKDKHIYALDTNTLNLQPGQHVTLKGRVRKTHSGTRDFGVNKLVKDEGTCSERATSSSTWKTNGSCYPHLAACSHPTSVASGAGKWQDQRKVPSKYD
jgi:hypothetical protein